MLGNVVRGFVISCGLVSLCSAAAAQDIGDELFFPGEQFDELVYQPRQSSDDPVYESILMDLRTANFEPLAVFPPDDPIRKMAEPVGLLKVLHKSNKYNTCTASVIDRDLILTNWHCLPKYGAEVSRAVLQMGFYRADDASGVRTYSVDIRPTENDRALDYAILRVDGDLSEWGVVRLAAVDPSANASLSVVHHPGGQPKQITQRSCRASAPPISQNRLMHKCDTMGGSSGAPVFLGYGAGAEMVALHYAGVPQSQLGIDPSLESNMAVPVTRLVKSSKLLADLVGDQTIAAGRPSVRQKPAVPSRGLWKDFPAANVFKAGMDGSEFDRGKFETFCGGLKTNDVVYLALRINGTGERPRYPWRISTYDFAGSPGLIISLPDSPEPWSGGVAYNLISDGQGHGSIYIANGDHIVEGYFVVKRILGIHQGWVEIALSEIEPTRARFEFGVPGN